MNKYYPKQTDKDHVLVEITMAVMIGVDELEDDTPNDFCNQVREGVRNTGAIVLTSSIVGKKRLNFQGSAREMLAKDAETNKDNPLHSGGDKEKEK